MKEENNHVCKKYDQFFLVRVVVEFNNTATGHTYVVRLEPTVKKSV